MLRFDKLSEQHHFPFRTSECFLEMQQTTNLVMYYQKQTFLFYEVLGTSGVAFDIHIQFTSVFDINFTLHLSTLIVQRSRT